jgi:hypothetical protein
MQAQGTVTSCCRRENHWSTCHWLQNKLWVGWHRRVVLSAIFGRCFMRVWKQNFSRNAQVSRLSQWTEFLISLLPSNPYDWGLQNSFSKVISDRWLTLEGSYTFMAKCGQRRIQGEGKVEYYSTLSRIWSIRVKLRFFVVLVTENTSLKLRSFDLSKISLRTYMGVV